MDTKERVENLAWAGGATMVITLAILVSLFIFPVLVLAFIFFVAYLIVLYVRAPEPEENHHAKKFKT